MSKPDEILDEQRRRWSQGERVLVETYLQRLPTLGADRNVVLDLIYHEIVLREKAGERPEQQEYAQRFPHLSAELALQFEVDRGLDWQAVGAGPSPSASEGPSLALGLGPAREPSGGTPYPSLPGYAIAGVLGRGASGVVYKARQLGPDRSVAVKVVLAGMREQADALVQLRAQAATLAGLHHPHLCPIHEIGVDAGRLFIVQERVEGSLARRLTDAPVTPRQAAQWLETLARTVDDLHRHGSMHGNLTPANVLMSYNGTLKITDIGLARFVDPFRRPSTATNDRTGDVYGLGAILFTLLAGCPPAPRDLETICLHCLDADPARRYASAAALAEDLNAFLAGKPIRAQRAALTTRLANWARRLAESWRSSASTHGLLHEARQQRRRAERVQRTLDLTCRLMRITDRDDLLRLLAEAAAWLTSAELVTIFLVDPERDLRAHLSRGTEVEELHLPLGVGIPGAVATTRAPINLTDAYGDARFDPDIDRRTGIKTRCLLALPLTSGDGVVLGVVQAINKRDGAFDAEDMEALSALLAAAMIAVERAVS
jgi:tRNA A-37 threonylcarbamoyl transferase component Bud32